nr:unnamed protein product [Callosobruchus analis]
MKAYKSLQAYKYFEVGFIHKCGAIKINSFMIVVGWTKIDYDTIKNKDFGWIIKSHKVKEVIPCIKGSEMIEYLNKIEELGSFSSLMRVLEPFASEMAVMEDRIC